MTKFDLSSFAVVVDQIQYNFGSLDKHQFTNIETSEKSKH